MSEIGGATFQRNTAIMLLTWPYLIFLCFKIIPYIQPLEQRDPRLFWWGIYIP